MPRDEELVLLAVAGSEVEAGMWHDALDQAGIPTLVRPGGPGAGAWASAATFEHQVFVRADQLDAAQHLLGGGIGRTPPLPRIRHAAPVVNRTRKTSPDSR